jgi:penicillin-binding protein 1C
MRRAPRRTAFLLLLLGAAVAFWQCLPRPLFTDPVSTVVYSRDGMLLGARIADDEQWRFPPSGTVPEKYARALIEFEDRRFYRHPGVDPLALGRAVIANFRRGRVISGASTLSMQVIRLSRKNLSRTYLEKFREILLSLRLELACNKDEILALHAGHAPFGGNVVGLEAAAWRYFGRNAAQLSWAESCMLAILPNSPALIHPGRNRQQLLEKRDRLLRRIHDQGLLNDLDLKLALLEPLPGQPRPMPQLAPHLRDTLQADFPDRHLFRTTIDSVIQRQADETVRQHSGRLGLRGIHNAAALIVDNRSFEVLAYVGNSDHQGDRELGYAIDIVRRPRSTGSILKPMLFAVMLQSGDILPTTLVPDIPTQFNGYRPLNYDHGYRGAVPAQEALARSLNVPAVRMLQGYGLERFYTALKNMGMTTLFRPAENYGLTLILGGAEGTLWDLAGIYANMAAIARGDKSPPSGRYGRLRLLADQPVETDRPIDYGPAAAWLTFEALLEVSRPGNDSFWRNFSSSRKIAWKTGTSYGLRDGWAIGSTPRHTVAVWTGNAGGEGNPELTGVGAAAPLLFDLFDFLDGSEWFEQPNRFMKQVEVCIDDGYLGNSSCETRVQWVPRESHFEQVTPYHRRVHLDPASNRQVHGNCESPANMVSSDWFVLPPAQEAFYRRHHPEYRTLPPFRPDCRALAGTDGGDGPIGLLYPHSGARIFIPTDLDGQRTEVVLDAVHREPDTLLNWHLDDQFLGTTMTFHQQTIYVEPGRHVITLVDESGNRLQRRFEVLSRGGS